MDVLCIDIAALSKNNLHSERVLQIVPHVRARLVFALVRRLGHVLPQLEQTQLANLSSSRQPLRWKDFVHMSGTAGSCLHWMASRVGREKWMHSLLKGWAFSMPSLRLSTFFNLHFGVSYSLWSLHQLDLREYLLQPWERSQALRRVIPKGLIISLQQLELRAAPGLDSSGRCLEIRVCSLTEMSLDECLLLWFRGCWRDCRMKSYLVTEPCRCISESRVCLLDCLDHSPAFFLHMDPFTHCLLDVSLLAMGSYTPWLPHLDH